MVTYSSFADGVSHLASAAWVLYSPTSDLVSSGGTCLGPTTNNIAEYHAVIRLLTKSLSNNVIYIMVYLDSKLVVSHLNRT